MLWKVDRQEMSQGRSIRQCFGRLADRKCSKVGVSGSALEDYKRKNNPNLLSLGRDLNVVGFFCRIMKV